MTAFEEISIHALREEGDQIRKFPTTTTVNFYPRPPRGGRRDLAGAPGAIYRFLSTPSARRATQALQNLFDLVQISIHALREEGDRRKTSPSSTRAISIHALREEGDLDDDHDGQQQTNFYPRPPRGGRLHQRMAFSQRRYFYPRPPRGGRHDYSFSHFLFLHFYPRPPRGGRLTLFCIVIPIYKFLSTPSARRATQEIQVCTGQAADFYPRPPRGGRPTRPARGTFRQTISIHALREEGDGFRFFPWLHPGHFYPRPPRGGRPKPRKRARVSAAFLSTPSARRATTGSSARTS